MKPSWRMRQTAESDPLRPTKPPAEDLVRCDGIWMSRRAASERAGVHLAEICILLMKTAAVLLSRIEG